MCRTNETRGASKHALNHGNPTYTERVVSIFLMIAIAPLLRTRTTLSADGPLTGLVLISASSALFCQWHGPFPSPPQAQKPDHIFCQGFWIALRLDLLQWFMPLPTASASAATAATANNDASASFTGGDEETAEESATNRAAAAALAATGTTLNTDNTATGRIAEPEHVSILDIITSVNASADIWGFALATWRGAENRDGFVLDIERLVWFWFWVGAFLACNPSCARARSRSTTTNELSLTADTP